jgi:hypothetical protein
MALDSAGVADVSLSDILFNDIQEYLAQDAVIIGTITNLTSRIRKGQKEVSIPRTSGLAAADVKQDNTEAASSGLTLGADVMVLDQFREVPEYIFEGGDLESTVDLKQAFLDAATKTMADDIETTLYSELKKASSAAPDHVFQLSESTNTRPSLADIELAMQTLDEANVPNSDRFLLVSPAIKVHLIGKDAIRDASQAGTNSALINGEFSRLYGFTMISSNNVDANEMIAYHRSALAYGSQKEVEFIEEPQRSKGREFVSVRTKYGTKILDSGKRCILFNATGTP